MIKIFIAAILLMSSPSFSAVTPEQCISIEDDVGIASLFSMEEDLNIPPSQIDKGKTKTEILYIEPVTYELALFYGKKETTLSGTNSEDRTTAEQYAEGFMWNNSKNLIVKYNFYNHEGKENILIISAFISDIDCAVRFNGHVVVKREF